MAERETSRDIDAQAADWIARRDRAQLSAADAHALEFWLSGDPRRRGALLRANALSMLSESAQALGSGFDPRHFAPATRASRATMSRRGVLAWAGAGSAAALSLVALGISAPAFGTITTRRGEIRLVTLDDGSTMMLNTETSVRVRYSDSERLVTMSYGEAFFTVSPDARRSFVVDAAEAHLRAAHGTFRVRRLDGRPVDILVNHGAVAVQMGGGQAPIVLPANSRLSLPRADGGNVAPAPRPVSPGDVLRELAWRDGKLAFEGERLDVAAAEFARYSPVRIRIADPALAAEPVTGLFAAGDPIGFGHAIAGIFDATVERRDDSVILRRSGRSR